MENRLVDKIMKARGELTADPAGIVIGELKAPNPEVEIPDGEIASYFVFLTLCDGARCGVIDFWSYEKLSQNQFRVDHIPDAPDNWICIGQVLYDPLAVHIETGDIYLFGKGPPPDTEGTKYPEFERFLDHYVFGLGYLDVTPNPEKDRWAQFLAQIGFLE